VNDGTIGPLARKAILLGTGIARSPATHLAVRAMLGNHFLMVPDDTAESLDERTMQLVDAIESAASLGTPGDQFAAKVGELAPELGMALTAFGAGRFAARQGLRGLAEAFPQAGFSRPVLAKAAERVTDFPVATPRIQQVAEIVGGNLGIGVAEAGMARERGLSRREALKRGAVIAGAGAGIESVTRGVGKLAFRGRELRKAALEFPEDTKKALKQRLRDVRGEIRRTNKAINEANEVLAQQMELEKMAAGAAVIRRQTKQGSVPFVPAEVQQSLRAQLDDVVRPGTVAKKRRRTEEKLISRGRKKQKETKQRKVLEDLLDPNPSLLSYVRQSPIGADKPPGMRAMLRFWHGLASTPEGLAPKLGPSGFKLMQLLDEASVASLIGRAKWSKRMSELRELSKPDRRLLNDAFELYESPGGSVKAVTDRYGTRLGKVVGDVKTILDDLNARVTAVGGQPAMTEKLMRRNKVGNFLPQVHKATDEGDYIETGAKAMAREEGISIEAARAQPGTTAAKLRAGVPLIDDPLEAVFVHAQEIEHRLALTERFGFDLGVANTLIDTAGREGADIRMLNTLANHMLGHNYHDRWLNSFARVATNWEAFTKMTYAIIPNFFQPIANNPLLFGVRGSARGLLTGIRKEADVDIEVALGLMDNYLEQLRRSFEFGERRLGITGTLANAALVPFQAMEKRWNRWFTGNVAYSTIMKILAQAEAGSLRGATLDRARRIMFDAGLDLTKIARQGPTEWLRTSEDELLGAIFKLTRRTQFIPTPAIRPAFWSHPIGRVMSQFGTFALNQGRLMKDVVLGEAGRGNFGPLAYALSVHPVIGEITIDIIDSIKGRRRSLAAQNSLLIRALEDFAAVGNFGFGHSMVKSAQFSARRRGISAFTGPFFSDVDELIENVAAGNTVGLARQVVKQPVVDASIRLYNLGVVPFAELAVGILGTIGEQLSVESQPEEESAPTLEELGRQDRRRRFVE
jgi:hypothetical protein